MSHHYRSCSERQPQPQEFQSNPIIRVHPDSQQSLDRLFNPVQTAVPLRDRQLPKSFFNPGFKANESNDNNNNNNGTTNGNHHAPNQSVHFRSMSFDQRPNGRVHQSFHMRTASTLAPMPVLASSNQSSHQSSSNEFNSFTNNSTSQSANGGWSSSGNSMEDLMATKCEISNGGTGCQSIVQQAPASAATATTTTGTNGQPGQILLEQQQSQQRNTHYHSTIHHHHPAQSPMHQQQQPPTTMQQAQQHVNHHHHHHHSHPNNHQHYAPIIHSHQQQASQSPLQQQPAPTTMQQPPPPPPQPIHHEHVPMHSHQPMQHQQQQAPQDHLARPAFYSSGTNNHINHHCTNHVTPVTNNLHSRSMSFDQRQGPRTMNQNFHMRTHSTVLAPMSGASSTNHSSHQSSHEFLNYTNQTIQSANEWSSSGYSTDDMTANGVSGGVACGATNTTTNWIPGQSQQVHAQPVQHHMMQPHHQPHQMMMQPQHHQPIQPPQQAPQQVFYT